MYITSTSHLLYDPSKVRVIFLLLDEEVEIKISISLVIVKLSVFAKQKQTYRYRKQTDGCEAGGGLGGMVKQVKGWRSTNWQSQNS